MGASTLHIVKLKHSDGKLAGAMRIGSGHAAGGEDSQRGKSDPSEPEDVRCKYVCGRELEAIEYVREVGASDEEVVPPAELALGLAGHAGVEHDHVVLAEEPRVLDLGLHPCGVEAGGMEENEGGFRWVEGADVVGEGIGAVPD